MLASRSREILKIIAISIQPIRIQELAHQFQVSSRTIKYDLDAIRDFLKFRDVQLHSRPNMGIWLEETQVSRQKLMDILEEDVQYGAVFSSQERVGYITTWLLLNEGHMTLAQIADSLFVSRNTVISDMKQVENYLSKWNIQLERQPRIGIRAIGVESVRRKSIENTVLDLLNGSDMFQIIQVVHGTDEARFPRKKLSRLFHLNVAEVEALCRGIINIVSISSERGPFLADREIIGVFIRLCIMVCRARELSKYGKCFKESFQYSNWEAHFLEIVQETFLYLSQEIGVSFSESDLLYIGRYFVSEGVGLFGTTEFTQSLIDTVGKRMGVQFQSDPELFDNLLAHITSRINKYRSGLPEPNPLTSDITRNYPVLFSHVKSACLDVFQPRQIELGDSDIAYLVLHFAAAYERLIGSIKFNALVVCSTGRGNARFLKNFFENEVKQLRVVACCSVNEVPSMIHSLSVDLVISSLSVEVPSGIPRVLVNHLPTKQDVKSICSHLDRLDPKLSFGRGNLLHRNNQFFSQFGMLQLQISPEALRSVELMSQNIITKGFELSHLIISSFRNYLTDDSVLGLTLHILLMVNRLAFNSPYNYEIILESKERDYLSELRDGLKELLQERHIAIPQAEVDAILRYFSEYQRGEGET